MRHRLQDEVISGGHPQELAQNRTNDLVVKFLCARYGSEPSDWGGLPPNFASVVRAKLTANASCPVSCTLNSENCSLSLFADRVAQRISWLSHIRRGCERHSSAEGGAG